ncbi:glycosyltransferase family 4 protein [Lacrimispora xylanolytica]|uniref:Glycosyltransferase family 4 protein n=1 Tax=Lacrimispora xylanolytica TaxID=29375 RepID=A0ABY7ABM2_9FIRM|nr:glycosyltransferase family 4 protein [Lacrimispora xylanolytica]WAJ24099.1 glycosyltransferase family 4 protein [Lacrimispora xylanolytica]
MRIIIFGIGKMYERHKHELSKLPIVAFLDNDPSNQGATLNGVIIESPSNIHKYSYDYIFIMSVHYKEMRKQLLQQGVSSTRIIDIEHRGFLEGLHEIKYYIKKKKIKNRKSILLCSHDLCLTGAPLVLYYAASILKDYYNITVFSKSDGPLRYDYLELDISVVICNDISLDNLEIYKFFDEFDLLFVNTLVFSTNINDMASLNKPVLWWLHEDKDVYNYLGISSIKCILNENIYPYSVSTCVDSVFYQHYDAEIKRMRYGIPYENNKSESKEKNKLIFAIVGSVGKRKAQDIFIEATKKLTTNNENIECWIIGEIQDEYRNMYEREKGVRVFGSLSHEQVMELYLDIDIIVCPSLYDPLPVVLTEGMMLKKVCIMSDTTGTAEIIEPYKNGLICKSGDVDDLAGKMQWVINNNEKLPAIGEEAYNVYENYFSMNQYKKSLINNISDLLNATRKRNQ